MPGRKKSLQAGMTLIEVLVAMLILSTGFLGAAAVQVSALKYTSSAQMKTQASFIAYDMMDRIRANSGADYTITPPTSGNLSVARDQDLFDFTSNIASALGATATGTIALSQRVYTITIAWDDSRAANTNTRRSFILTSRATVDPVSTP